METQPLIIAPRVPPLELDLIADLVCPWSYVGKRSLEPVSDPRPLQF